MDCEVGGSGGDVARAGGMSKRESSYLAEALKKCLRETKGDHKICRAKIDALRSSPSSSASSLPPRKPVSLLKLRRGSLTDV